LTTLAGTAGSWFLYDVAYYGTGIFTPKILHDICLTGKKVGGTCEQTVFQTSSESFIVAMMGIPGCVIAICLIGRMGSKRLNTIGFVLLAVSFAAFAIVWNVDSNQHEVLFGLFCLITFLLNWGPNLGTFVLPALCFPTSIRSTCHGLSACGGKLGALCGALLFAPISSNYGMACVLWIQVGACIGGLAISQIFLRNDWEYLEECDRIATMSWIEGSCTGGSIASQPPS
jgi:PHS family inorganic phosphate transporter-like MFS transporter